MKHSFTSSKGHSLEVRQSNNSTKLFLSIDGKPFKRIDSQPLKPAIVTALLQEIINQNKRADDLYNAFCQKLRENSKSSKVFLDPLGLP